MKKSKSILGHNYISLINSFWLVDLEANFSHLEIHLFFKLLEINNRLGWKKTFRYANSRLESEIGTRSKNLIAARQRLANFCVIHYEKGTTREAGIYSLLSNSQSFEPTKEGNYGNNRGGIKEVNGDILIKQNQTIQEKKSLFRERFDLILEIFYFKNYRNPTKVTEAFYSYYEGLGWKNGSGAEIENPVPVARNWENKTTEGTICNESLLAKWKAMFETLKEETEDYPKFLLIFPIKLENHTLTIKGKRENIEDIEANGELLKLWKPAIKLAFGNIKVDYHGEGKLANHVY